MSLTDVVLLALLLIGGYRGYKKGLLREVIAILALIIGVIAGLMFLVEGSAFLSQVIHTYSPVLSIISFFLIFFCTVILITLLGRVIKTVIDLTPLGYLDGIVGGLLGLLKWAFVISLGLWFLNMADMNIEPAEESQLYSKIKFFAPVVIEKVKGWFPVLEDLIRKITEFMESLKS